MLLAEALLERQQCGKKTPQSSSISSDMGRLPSDRSRVVAVYLCSGRRPVVLLGWSNGARLIFACLEHLAARGTAGEGIVESAFLVGTPETADAARWAGCRRVCAHRLVNAYSTSDWLLPVLHRSTNVALGSLAGLEPIPLSTVENYDVRPPSQLPCANLHCASVCHRHGRRPGVGFGLGRPVTGPCQLPQDSRGDFPGARRRGRHRRPATAAAATWRDRGRCRRPCPPRGRV